MTAATLVANLDAVPSTLSSNTPKTLINVFDNDTKNGTALIPSDVKLTVTTADPKGYLTVDTNGNAILAANAPAGTYELTYEICELLNPTNCSSNQVQVTITAPGIDAVADNLGSINGNMGGTTTVSLIAADTVNAAQAVIGTNPGEVKLTVTAPIPTGLTINTNGTVTVAANTPAGSYNLEYTICEINNPANCDTATSTIVVTAATLVANLDAVPSTISSNAPKTLVNVFDNDTKNGTALIPSDVKLTVTTADPKGYLTVDTNGNAILAANAPAGTYELTYEICELLNPTNCSSNQVQVTITAPGIDAVADNLGSINGNMGGTTTVSLIAADTVNAAQAVIGTNPGEVKLTVTAPIPTGLTINTNGTVTVAANTPAGSYNLEYNICEINNPGNCDTATSTVVVTAPSIDAVADNLGSINGNAGGNTTVSLIAADTVNSAQAVIGTNPGDVKLTVTTPIPTGLTINTNGTVTVAANTPAGSYNLEYTICEINNPANCDTATSTVVVTAATLVANLDAVPSTLSSNTPKTLTNVFDNDTKNGTALIPSDVKLTVTTADPKGYLTVDTNGNAILAANAPAGTYQLTYEICELLNPTNCSSNQVQVTITAPGIDAVTDNLGSINGNAGGTTTVSLIADDTVNGSQAVIGTNPGDVKLTVTTPIPTGLTINTNGTVTVAANTPAGTYNLEYTICEINNPGNCDTATSTVVVTAPSIDAVAENLGSINGNSGGTTTVSLIADDTVNGSQAVIGTNPGDVKLTVTTPIPTGLTINTNGTVTVAANTPAGTYNLEYTICEINNPGNCDTATSTVVVTAPSIDAVAENLGSINGNSGGTTTVSLIASDTVNGSQAVIGTNPGDVKLTVTTPIPAGLTINTNGTVTVAANTPAGTYNLEYTICEINNPGNCDTATSKIVVTVATLVANLDAVPSTLSSNAPKTLINVFDNDTKNGAALIPSEVKLTVTTADPKGYLTVDVNGNAILGANAPAGTYQLTYEICELLNPTNCSSNQVQVTITAPGIDAVAENLGSINGNAGGTTTVSLIAADTVNAAQAVIGTNPGDVKLTVTTPIPTGLTINSDGTVTVAANTPAGSYNLEYNICEINNPGNCDTATSTVVVTAPSIDAVADNLGSINGNAGGTTTVSLIAGDTVNAAQAVIGTNPGDVKLTVTASVPTGLTINTNGTVTVAANTPAGTYNLEYTICEINNPGNCDTATSTIVVTAATLVANLDAVPSTLSSNTPKTLINVFDNDTKNGTALIPSDVKLTVTTADPKGYLTVDTNGNAILGANAPAGTYELTYEICELLNPTNCSSNQVKVTITAPSIDAVADNLGSINGNAGGTTTVSLIAADTVNAAQAVIGTNPGDVKLTVTTPIPTGLTINTNGTITVAAYTPAGSYNLEYTICEINNPGNCDTVTSTIVVTAPGIEAVADNLGSINGNAGGTTAISLIASDTVNAAQAVIGTNPGDVKLTVTTPIPAGLTINTNGTVTVAANTPAGTYNLEYTICEINNPGNCDTATSTILVTAATLVANLDAVPSTLSSNTPKTLINVFDNDTKNGTALIPSDVKLTVTAADPKGYLTVDTNGNAILGANAPAGTYELTYEICELLNPTNCSSNQVKVTITAPSIDAVAENLGSINGNAGGTTTVSLIAGDTVKAAQAVIGTNPGEVKLTVTTPIPPGLTINTNGTVTVAANTPAGSYNLEYTICEINNPGNCDTATSTVVVTAELLLANADTVESIVGINQPKNLLNIFSNDTKNGFPIVASEINLTVLTTDPTGFVKLNPDGTLVLAANAPAGTYELTYQICEKLNPTSCSTASVKVTVVAPAMTVTATGYCANNVPYVTYNVVADNFTPTDLLTIKWIDSANNVVATQTNLPLSGNILWPGAVIDSNGNGLDWPGWLLANGQWTEGADGFEKTRPAVTMEFSLNPTKSVVVNYPTATPQCNARPTFTIQAKDDMAGPIDASKGVNTSLNIFDNDILNGSAINPANAVLSTVIPNANLILNHNGAVEVKLGTPSGTYQLTYQICDVSNPSNCSQAIVTVTVLNATTPINPTAPIVANDDAEVAVDGINGSLEFINVLDNDLLNGTAINPTDILITKTSASPNFELNADGTVNVLPNTPGGQYTVTYQICEKASATNCSSAALHVFVEFPAIAIIKTGTFNDENASGFANAGETITYKFKITNTGNVPLKGITIRDPLPGIEVSGQTIDLDVNETDENTFTAQYKIKQSDINLGSVSNQATAQGVSARGVVVEDKSDNEDNLGDKPTVLALNGCMIEPLKAFSPNGDNKNTRFYIRGIECYPENTVEIYNRWGVLVYDADHYNNEDRVFKGFSEGRATVKQSDGLPVGTYFYILKYKDSASNSHELSGYLYMNK
ncbi:gliding motility-associated C-terminal domain-containing protein [Flavobacterium cupreum]|uniref:Gliding motility-associated C-terminal domain-containing protein n=1 Tax=Flavobacterium cupreum TaxID=2133766 RepID=A0A434A999_9FLAO|nr:gliding motility-associated C-terminal domain-containing protein [Flavobacterium cupreum]